jgi:EAL domain-containing protein (putative c-di-GMP-specific phosphodiesterase class I)
MSSAYRVELASGEVLFHEGDRPTTAFLIDEGVLRISARVHGEIAILGELGPGSLVGEMAVLDDSPRSATVTALSRCVLTPIDRAQFAERLETADPVVQALLRSQLTRYRSALATLGGEARKPAPAAALTAPNVPIGHDKIRLESELREALDLHQLDVLLQPIWHIGEQRTAGYEALTRWQHPERGAVSPAEFIALAEETSLIVPVGEYVLREVCTALQRFAQQGSAALPFIALNVSGRQLQDGQFVQRVLAQLHASGIAPAQLKLEITESLVLDYPKVDALITHCHACGIRVALDDFGTGYSNLGHLHKLAFDTLKLDQGFIRQLDDPRCLAIVQAVISMARALHCELVAEGVETQAQLEQLAALDCDYAQGYLTGRPQPVAVALAALALERGASDRVRAPS